MDKFFYTIMPFLETIRYVYTKISTKKNFNKKQKNQEVAG